MKFLEIVKMNKCINLENVKCIHVSSCKRRDYHYCVYADDIEISKLFENKEEAIKELDKILNCVINLKDYYIDK